LGPPTRFHAENRINQIFADLLIIHLSVPRYMRIAHRSLMLTALAEQARKVRTNGPHTVVFGPASARTSRPRMRPCVAGGDLRAGRPQQKAAHTPHAKRPTAFADSLPACARTFAYARSRAFSRSPLWAQQGQVCAPADASPSCLPLLFPAWFLFCSSFWPAAVPRN
jgi:hypothetical protein